jgi:hypothetical protein
MRGLAVLFMLLGWCVQAQTDSVYTGKPPGERPEPRKNRDPLAFSKWKDRVTFGGNFQAWFGTHTFVNISPTIGFNVVENLNVGVGAIYNYTSLDFGPAGKYSQSIFGSHTYARYVIRGTYFAQVQYDRLRQPDLFSYVPGKKIWVDYFLVGGGIRRELGDHAALILSVMFNLTQHPLSVYPNPLVQVGIVAGL